MAYYGTTAASSVRNPPRLISSGGLYSTPNSSRLETSPEAPGAQGGKLWTYCSTNKTTDVKAAGFFSDAEKLGMGPGDIVLNTQFTAAGSSAKVGLFVVTSVSTAGAASLSSQYMTSTRASSL